MVEATHDVLFSFEDWRKLQGCLAGSIVVRLKAEKDHFEEIVNYHVAGIVFRCLLECLTFYSLAML